MIKKLFFSLVFFISFGFSQSRISSDAIRKVRLENFQKNYAGKVIRFLGPKNIQVEGKLLDVTPESFILSDNTFQKAYNHRHINHVYVIPNKKDLLLACSLSIIGGVVSYFSLLVSKENPKTQIIRSVVFLGMITGGLVGKNTFYKPLKIDISGKAYG